MQTYFCMAVKSLREKQQKYLWVHRLTHRLWGDFDLLHKLYVLCRTFHADKTSDGKENNLLVDWLIDSCFGYLETTLLAVNSITTYMMVVCGIHENKLACKHIRIMFIVGNVDRYNDCYSGRHSSQHSIDTRSTLGRHSVATQSTVDQQSTDTPSIVDRQSVDGRSTCMLADISFQVTDTWPTLRWYLTDTWPTLRRHFTLDRY